MATKTVSVRQFQLRAGQYLKSNEPLILTVYNRPVAKIEPLTANTNVSSYSVSDSPDGYPHEGGMMPPPREAIKHKTKYINNNTENIKHNINDIGNMNTSNIDTVTARELGDIKSIGNMETMSMGPAGVSPVLGFCQETYEPGKQQPCYRTSYEDVNGTVIWTKLLCAACWKNISGKVDRYGGKLRYDI